AGRGATRLEARRLKLGVLGHDPLDHDTGWPLGRERLPAGAGAGPAGETGGKGGDTGCAPVPRRLRPQPRAAAASILVPEGAEAIARRHGTDAVERDPRGRSIRRAVDPCAGRVV